MTQNILSLMQGDGRKALKEDASKAIQAGRFPCMSVCTVKGGQAQWTRMPELADYIQKRQTECHNREHSTALRDLLVCLSDWQTLMQDGNKHLTNVEKRDVDGVTKRWRESLQAVDITKLMEEDFIEPLTKELSQLFSTHCTAGGMRYVSRYGEESGRESRRVFDAQLQELILKHMLAGETNGSLLKTLLCKKGGASKMGAAGPHEPDNLKLLENCLLNPLIQAAKDFIVIKDTSLDDPAWIHDSAKELLAGISSSADAGRTGAFKRALEIRRQWIELIVRDELGKVASALKAITEADLKRTIVNAALTRANAVDATDASNDSFPELCERLHALRGGGVTQTRWGHVRSHYPKLVRHTGPMVEEYFEDYMYATCEQVAESMVQRLKMELERVGSNSSFEELNAALLRHLKPFRDTLRAKGVTYDPKLFTDLGLEEPASAEPQVKRKAKPTAAIKARQQAREGLGDVPKRALPIADLEKHEWEAFFRLPTDVEKEGVLIVCKLTDLKKFFKSHLQGDARLLVGDQRAKMTFIKAIIKSKDRLLSAKRQRK